MQLWKLNENSAFEGRDQGLGLVKIVWNISISFLHNEVKSCFSYMYLWEDFVMVEVGEGVGKKMDMDEKYAIFFSQPISRS